MLATLLITLLLSSEVAQADQSVPVQRGARLDIDNFAGEVIVRTWEKDAVRVQAGDSERDRIDLRAGSPVVTVRVRSSPGPRSMDLTVTVPAWMGVRVDGTYLDVRVEGTQGDVSVETVRGDVIVRGGTGAISLSSVEGLVDVEKARGKLKASSVNESVRVADSSGDVTIETVNGDITMERMGATSVDAATVNGDIRYVGTMKGTGAYRMSTHNGTVTLAIPQDSDVTVTARTYSGSFSSVYPEKPTETDDGSRRTTKRRTVVLGSGAARAELESFQGSIRISGPTAAAPATKKPQ